MQFAVGFYFVFPFWSRWRVPWSKSMFKMHSNGCLLALFPLGMSVWKRFSFTYLQRLSDILRLFLICLLSLSCPLLLVLHGRSPSWDQAVSNNTFPYTKQQAFPTVCFELSSDFHVPVSSSVTQFLLSCLVTICERSLQLIGSYYIYSLIHPFLL